MDIKITDVRSQKGDASFLIDDGKHAILYDTGFGFTGYAIADNVKSVLGDRPLDYIFLTHSHYDHALGSAYVLRRYHEAKVVAGKYAVEIFQRDGAKKVMKKLDAGFARTCGITDYEFLGDELKVDLVVDDGDMIQVGDMEFRVLNLPGHTRCCIGFYCEREGLLLSSESLGVYDGKETILPLCLVSYADSIASIEKVEGLNVTSLVAPHFGLLDSAQTEFFLKNAKAFTQKIASDILESLKAGQSEEEIVEGYKEKYWHGYIREIYPEDAINLNTSIMIRLIKNELM